jgi:hypothetical protein
MNGSKNSGPERTEQGRSSELIDRIQRLADPARCDFGGGKYGRPEPKTD